jgi:hypothetical protein
MGQTLTRRQWAGALAAATAAPAQTPPPAAVADSPAELLAQAKQNIERNREALAKFEIERSQEPAVRFEA